MRSLLNRNFGIVALVLAAVGSFSFLADTRGANFTIGANFTGTSRSVSGFIPPDTMGAVGPSHIVELINGQYAVYNKSGTSLSSSSLNAFWTSAGVTPAGSFAFDPRIIYDKHSSRWYATSVDNAGGANNFLVAVSTSSDPTAGWTGFQIDADTDDVEWADFPMMGLNQDTLTISANMFRIDGTPGGNTSFLVIPKSDLLLGSPTDANATLFENVAPGSTGFSPQPVLDYDNNNLPQKILSSFNKFNDGVTGFLKTSSITGTAASPTLTTAGGFIAVTSKGAPPDIDQPGPKQDIDASNSRFSGNVIQQQIPGRTNPSLWGAHGVEISGRAAIEWYEIDAVTNSIIQSGTISDPSLAFNYPSIAVNDFGQVVIGFSGGDPSTFMSTYVMVGQTPSGTITTTVFDPLTQTKAGVADYLRLDTADPPRNRWGDYSATVVDPTNERTFWTFQEFASATDQWSIQITEINAVPEPSTLLLTGMGTLALAGFRWRRRRKKVA